MKKATPEAAMDEILAFLPLTKPILYIEEFTNAHGLLLAHIRVLLLLCGADSLSTTQIGCRLGISKPNVTPVIDRLLSRGLVLRGVNPDDRRVADISITEKGREYVAYMRRRMHEKARTVFAELTDDELLCLLEHIRAANDILSRLSITAAPSA